MNKSANEQWLKDFNEFTRSEVEVPKELSSRIFSKIHGFLNPSPLAIFLKVLVFHIAVGTLSLSICHQFGLNPFGTEQSLADWFMRVGGHSFCMIGCGVLFTALSILGAGYFLNSEEVRAFRRTKVLQGLSLSLLSLGAFAFFGAQLVLTFAGLWLLGALLGGFFATELVWRMKTKAA